MVEFINNYGIKRIQKGQKREAEKVFLEAFKEYLLFTTFFPNKDECIKKTSYFFRFVLNYGMRYGVVLATEGLEGFMILIPPESIKMTAWKMFLCGVNIFGYRVGVRSALKVGKICDSFYYKQEKLAPYPHWYLMFIAVKPSQQGKGIGSKLLKSAFEFMDKQRLPLYLETQSASNVEIYRGLGFRMLDASDVLGLNMKNYCMIKDAQK